MKYRDIIDYGRSGYDVLGMYSAIFGSVSGVVNDSRSDRLIKYDKVMEILKSLGIIKIYFEEIGSLGRRIVLGLEGTEMLVELNVSTETKIDKQLVSIAKGQPSYMFDDDDDEDSKYLTGDIKPVVPLADYSVVDSIELFYPTHHRGLPNTFWVRYDEAKFSKKKTADGIINIVQVTGQGHLTLKPLSLDIKTYGEDILDSNYNDSFIPAYNKIESFIQSAGGGFALLSGKPGTGKSSFITHLIAVADRLKKKFVVIPPAFGSAIVEPSFMGFCVNQLVGSVLIIEDAESILKSRKDSGENSAVTNILNLTDGLLSSVLDIKVIATVNVEENVDEALLRKGRLKVRYYFDLLNTDKANALLKKLGSDRVVTEPHTLADLYNVAEQVEFDGKTVRKKPMGFSQY